MHHLRMRKRTSPQGVNLCRPGLGTGNGSPRPECHPPSNHGEPPWQAPLRIQWTRNLERRTPTPLSRRDSIQADIQAHLYALPHCAFCVYAALPNLRSGHVRLSCSSACYKCETSCTPGTVMCPDGIELRISHTPCGISALAVCVVRNGMPSLRTTVGSVEWFPIFLEAGVCSF